MIDNLHIRLDQHAVQLRRRKLFLSVLSILSVLLVLSLIFGFIQHRIVSRNSQITKITEQVSWTINQSRELVSVSPGRSLQILTDQEKIIQEELAKTKNKAIIARLNQLLSLLKSTEGEIGLVHAVSPDLFLDLALIRSDISASQITLAGNKLLVLDKNNRRLISVSVENHSGEVIAAGDSLSDVISFTTDAKSVYFLHPHFVSATSLTSLTPPTEVISDSDNVWQNPVSLAVFAGNIYVLDKGNSEIYKYAGPAPTEAASWRGEGGFGPRRRWLSAGITPDLSDATNLSVDGDAWILYASGKISRFRQGSPLAFSTEPFTLSERQRVEGPISFFPTSSALWLLGSNSITALDLNSGSFISQWQFTGIQPISFVVNKSENKIFLLESSRIYEVGLP